jgi:DNA polymerase-3 subunit delta'
VGAQKVPAASDPPEAGTFAGVVGQQRAVAVLKAFVASPVHAYLLVGPPGSGLDEVGLAFAAALVCEQGGCGECQQCRAALAGVHPDVVVFERAGAKLSVGQAQEAVQRSLRSPRAARRQVLLLTELHLVEEAAPVLLKAVEEPPETTVFVMLAEDVPPELDTIASRCARVDLQPLDEATVAAVLVAEGTREDQAAVVAAAAGGRLDRARLLAADEGFAARLALWRAVPDRLDGTGATVSVLTDELLSSIDQPVEVLRKLHAGELRELADRASERGETVRGRADIEARHRREQRRVRTDELRAGLATLARAYRDRLASPDLGERRVGEAVAAVAAIDIASDEVIRNPNEQLLLEALLVRLSGDGQPARRGPRVR